MTKISFSLVFLLAASFSTEKFVKTKVADGITVSLPEGLYPMTQDDIAQRYPSVRAPLGAYTDMDRAIDFSVNISATSWPDADAEMAKGFFKAGLLNLYDRVDMISEGTQLLHKKKFIFFEFTSRISGDRRKQGIQDPIMKYTYIQYFLAKDRTLVFTFSCPKDEREVWQPIAHEMMKSIRVK